MIITCTIYPNTKNRSQNYNRRIKFSKNLLSLLLYITYLAKSFIALNKFRKLTRNNREVEIALQYAFVGMPFYFIMCFYFRQNMKEEMELIR